MPVIICHNGICLRPRLNQLPLQYLVWYKVHYFFWFSEFFMGQIQDPSAIPWIQEENVVSPLRLCSIFLLRTELTSGISEFILYLS